jgi:hypothetical protein
MKLEVFRQSGQIIDDEQQQLYNAEWAPIYDKVMDRIKQIHSDKSHRLFMRPAHHLSERMLNYMERQLFKKYSTQVFEELPKTAKQWQALMDKYKAPLLVAGRSDSTKLVIIVMDTLQG